MNFRVLSDVGQNGLRTGRHLKEKRAKMEHRFVRVLRGPERFQLAKRWIFLE